MGAGHLVAGRAYRVRREVMRGRDWGIGGFSDSSAEANRKRIAALQGQESEAAKRDKFTLALGVMPNE